MTPQEAFDKAVGGVIRQGGCSVITRKEDGLKQCMLRTKNGRRCALGWLIPDDLYKPEMENVNAGNLGYMGAIPDLPPPPGDVWKMLDKLQIAHDAAASKDDDKTALASFKLSALQIAKHYGLSTGVIDLAHDESQARTSK